MGLEITEELCRPETVNDAMADLEGSHHGGPPCRPVAIVAQRPIYHAPNGKDILGARLIGVESSAERGQGRVYFPICFAFPRIAGRASSIISRTSS